MNATQILLTNRFKIAKAELSTFKSSGSWLPSAATGLVDHHQERVHSMADIHSCYAFGLLQ